jgi:hypothetical protein
MNLSTIALIAAKLRATVAATTGSRKELPPGKDRLLLSALKNREAQGGSSGPRKLGDS